MKKIKERNGRIEGRKQGWETLCRSAITVERCKSGRFRQREQQPPQPSDGNVLSVWGKKEAKVAAAYKTEAGDEGPEVGDEGPEAGDKAHRSFWSWKEI